LQGDRGRKFIFHLDEAPTHHGHTRSKPFHNFRRRRDRISSREPRTRRQRSLAAGMIAIDEMSARQNSMRISFHFSPPAALASFAALADFTSAVFVP
jgi:hypothetical protein